MPVELNKMINIYIIEVKGKSGKAPNLYHRKDDNMGNEVDLILDYADNQKLIEIKPGKLFLAIFLKAHSTIRN